jgi:Holliday junction resolvasome RuvABC endonuclease subunit
MSYGHARVAFFSRIQSFFVDPNPKNTLLLSQARGMFVVAMKHKVLPAGGGME